MKILKFSATAARLHLSVRLVISSAFYFGISFAFSCSQPTKFSGAPAVTKEDDLTANAPVPSPLETESGSVDIDVKGQPSTAPDNSCELKASIVTKLPSGSGVKDATATVTVSHGKPKYKFEWSYGESILDSENPVNTVTGLSENVEYQVKATDGAGCSISKTVTIGKFEFDADYMLLEYQFLDGRDLDTRTSMVSPNVFQENSNDRLGWKLEHQWPKVPKIPFLIWGGDNLGTGFESVLVDLLVLKEQFPTTSKVSVNLEGFWYGSKGSLPVNVSATLWKGGGPVGPSQFTWKNPTALQTFEISSFGKRVTTKNHKGEGIATLNYDLNTNQGGFSPLQ